MSNENPQPKVKITPTSVVTMGPLTVLVFRKDTEQANGTQSETLVTIKRVGGEPDVIPLMELPALAMMLNAIAEPAMIAKSLMPPSKEGT